MSIEKIIYIIAGIVIVLFALVWLAKDAYNSATNIEGDEEDPF
jgi:hypothetical protein